ncbi:MAG: response regulator [Lachnospiraceae bacterium]|nr:response regulator [Lachnospiraceae bacterium]
MEKILIVDDETMVLTVTNNILKDKYQVFCAETAAEGIRLYDEEKPDLILSDLYMPDMNGLDMVEMLRATHDMQIPVIFMTGMNDEEDETRVFHQGAEDFLRKPFRAEVLLFRVERILTNRARILELTRESTTDGLTGFLNKISVERKLAETCRYENGVLAILDVDNFKLVNDLHGHEAGDRILTTFADLLRRNTRAEDIIGRIGGDEFIVFFKDISDENAVAGVIQRINEQLLSSSKRVLDDETDIPIGVSAGAVIVPRSGTDYAELFEKADKAVYYVKKNGKRACSVYNEDGNSEVFDAQAEDMQKMSLILGERNIANHALWVGQSAFGYIYRYMLRYMHRYQNTAYKVLFTIVFMSPDIDRGDFSTITEHLGNILKNALRNSDIMMQSAPNQFFLLLPGVTEPDIQKVIDRTITAWDKSEFHELAQIFYETELISPDNEDEEEEKREAAATEAPWVAIVDDEPENLCTAAKILQWEGIRVTTLDSGEALLSYTEEKHPDLILLDYQMPDLSGAETLARLREAEQLAQTAELPVIILTDGKEQEHDAAAMLTDAVDFIQKPFVPEVLSLRVRHAIELARRERKD